MAIIKSFAPFLNLSNFQVFENDDLPQSEYFRITELNETLTGGKNGFLIEGSEHLKESTEVKIEILDVEGNPIYFEPGDGTPEYYEGNSKLIAVHVYDDTPIGIGKITVLGELKTYLGENDAVTDVPSEWQGVYNVKWERSIQVNKNLSNETIVRFYKRPAVTIDEIVKPIITKTIPQVTQTGSLAGIPLNPPFGTDLTKWRAGIQYRLRIDDGPTWSSSVDENIVSVPSLGYSAKIREILSKTDVVVDTPYTASDNTVTTLPSSDYSVTFDNKEAKVIGESALTGSFAKMNFSNLKTFVGDVARVKVFRKSRNAVGDFQFVQESKLESSELLRDITTSQDTELSYGLFDAYNLETYWVTSSEDHPVSIDNGVLMASVKTDYNESSGGTQTISTSGSFSISKDVEYTLNFRTLLSGALDDSGKSIRAYFSGSNYEQNFLTASGSAIYRARQSLTQNILATNTVDDVHLKFDISGSDWYISNVSLKNAQDTSFSPDEFTLIQDIPRKLAVESFDFKFEFYDINNNYIPVDVLATKEFDGGNDFPTSGQLLTFESDRNAFRFISGSVQNPENQTIKFSLTRANLTGSVTFASSAFDIAGNFLDPSDYTVYPGALTSVSPAGALITIDNFTGSRVDGSESPYVGSVVYTASLEDLEEFETIYRLEDGENAPQLIVTSNANQFIYEPTTLSAKPQGQSITINAKRKNLASFSTPITVNSGSGAPGISGSTDNTTGVDTYTIHSNYYSASFAGSALEEVTYSFTGSDQFGIAYSDEVTISPVINFDGVSLVLSNESTAFPAKSTGEVEGGFASSKGNVQMFIGGNQITHDDIGGGRAKNTFDITSVSGDNVTPISTSPTTNEYGISAFDNSASSGSLTLDIEYLAGDNSTSQSFQKVVSYSKSKKAVPNVEVFAQPVAQTINASSVGSGSSTPENIVVKAKEGNTDRFTSIGAVTGSNGLTTSVSNEVITITSTASDMTSDTGVLQIPINFTDGEGTTGSKLVEVTVSRVRVGTPSVEVSVSPSAQTINADSKGSGSVSPQTINVKAFEGGVSRFTGFGTIEFSGGLSATANAFVDLSPSDENYIWSQNTTDTDPGTQGIKSVAGNGASTSNAQAVSSFRRINIGPGNLTTLLANLASAGSVGSDGFTYVLRLEHSAGGGRFKEYTIEKINTASSYFRIDLSENSHSGSISSYGSFVNSSNVPVTIKRRASNALVFTDTASNMTSDTETIAIPVNFTDGEGTTGTKTVEASITRTRTAQPSSNFSVSHPAQTVAAQSTGTITGTIQDITIDGFDGNTELTYNQGTLSNGQYKITNITGVSVSDTSPNSKTFSISSFSGDTASGSAELSFKDAEGTLGTTTVDFSLSKAKVATPVTTISANPQAQSVASNADFSSVGTPSAVTISVNEGGSDYTHTTGTVSANKFKITGVTNGTNNNNGTVTPTTPTGGSGTTSVVTLSYTNSEGTAFTSKTITINVGVAAQGSDGAQGIDGVAGVSGLSFDISPAGQSITRTQTPVTYGTPSAFTVNVFQGPTQLTYDNSSPYASGSFYIDNVSEGTNNNDKTITPTTPSSLTAVTTTFDINYTDVSGSTGTVSKSHITNVVIDGNTGPGIVHTGEWESGRNYQFSDNGGGTGRRDSVLYNDVYYAATAQHTSTNNTNASTGKPGSGPWESLGSQDLFVAAKIAIFEESFVKNTLNVGTNAPATGDDVSSANITIAGSGTNPYMSIGQSGTISNQGFDNPGVFIGNDTDGVAKLSLKKQSGTNYLKWDGNNLEIAGSITITSGNAATTTDVNNSVLSGSAAATSAQNAGVTAAANAAASASAVQGNVDGLNIPTVPTTFNPNNLTNVGTPSASGLYLGEDKMGFYNASSPAGWKAYLDNSGNFYLGAGTNIPFSFTASTGVLNVNRISATAGTVGGWNIDGTTLYSGTKGSDGAFTSAGSITIGNTGFISANGFYIDTDGNFVQERTKTKIKGTGGIKAFGDLFDTDATGPFIKNSGRFGDGTNAAALSNAFTFSGGDIRLNDGIGIGSSATSLATRFTNISTNFDTIDDYDSTVFGSCVLPGTKIISKRGEINVEDTKEDDIIKIFNFETNEWGWSSIDEIITNKVQGWSKIETELGKKLRCSNSHLLYHPDYPNCEISVDKLGVGGELYVYDGEGLVLDKIKSIESFNEEVQVWNYELNKVHNYISDGILSHNMAAKLQSVVTLGHAYKKRISENISRGDLVKLDSNNELIKVSSAKDTSVVGILWKKYELKIVQLTTGSVEDGWTPYTASEEMISSSYMDSFGDYLPNNETGSKEIWSVASIGDSIDYDKSGSYFTLTGFKMCNQGGDVVPGDLLCSSDTAGYLMKQPSEWVVTGFDGDSTPIYEERQSQCSYTVAKCMESSSWDSNGRMENVYGYLYCG